VTDRQKQRCYDAEWTWRDAEGEEKSVLSLDGARALLARILPPVTYEQTRVRPLDARNRGDGGWVDYRGHGEYVMSLRMPAYPSVIVHEAAHILTRLSDGTDDHGPEFRRTLIWLLRQTHGARCAARLGDTFTAARLRW
jgi:hypothetical protein